MANPARAQHNDPYLLLDPPGPCKLQDPDLDAISLGPGPEELTLSCRPDKKARKATPLKFASRQRAALLTDLLQCLSALAARNRSPLAQRLLGWVGVRCAGAGWGLAGEGALHGMMRSAGTAIIASPVPGCAGGAQERAWAGLRVF